jgi:hypothetical protein
MFSTWDADVICGRRAIRPPGGTPPLGVSQPALGRSNWGHAATLSFSRYALPPSVPAVWRPGSGTDAYDWHPAGDRLQRVRAGQVPEHRPLVAARGAFRDRPRVGIRQRLAVHVGSTGAATPARQVTAHPRGSQRHMRCTSTSVSAAVRPPRHSCAGYLEPREPERFPVTAPRAGGEFFLRARHDLLFPYAHGNLLALADSYWASSVNAPHKRGQRRVMAWRMTVFEALARCPRGFSLDPPNDSLRSKGPDL